MKPSASQIHPPGLYLVATPIGNLRDITLRALDVLAQADLIACEDTRVTARLLSAYGIGAPTLSYNDHNAAGRRPAILSALQGGQRVALVSDAGTPLVSDPGYKLVREAIAEGHHVSALPGPSAALMALTLSGLPTDRFFFAGFLPPKTEAAKKELQALKTVPSTLVFFESTRRLPQAMAAMAEVLGNREAAVARELTKAFEETRRGPLKTLARRYEKEGAPKGEAVIVVAPPGRETASEADLRAQLELLLPAHGIKDAAAILAEQTGLPRKEIYALALKMKNA